MNVINVDLALPTRYLGEGNTVSVCSVAGKLLSLSALNSPQNNHVTFEDYLQVLDHRVIEPYLRHRIHTRLLCCELLKTYIWWSLYQRYGGYLFKLLTGPYEVFQLIPGTDSYMQVSGVALSKVILFGDSVISSATQVISSTSTSSTSTSSLSILSTQRTPATSQTPHARVLLQTRQKMRRQLFKRQTSQNRLLTAVGSHMFACQLKPRTSPDRLFGRMSYVRWYKDVFGCLPSPLSPCKQLQLLHHNFRNLAFAHLIESFTKSSAVPNPTNVFEHAVPHWKIKQMVKRILRELKIRSLLFARKDAYQSLCSSLLNVFTCNRYTVFSLSYLTRGVKLSACDWLKEVATDRTDKQKKFVAFVSWLVKMLTYIIKYYFYVTESREFRKRTHFFLRDYWEKMVKVTLEGYVSSKVFVRTDNSSPANHRLRFLAGSNKLRPILSTIKKAFPPKSRYQLMDVLACLKFVRSDPASGLAVCTDVLHALRQLCMINSTGKVHTRYYFVKADISKCYDSIDRKLLLNIIARRMTEMDVEKFLCWRIAVVLSGKDKPSVTFIDYVDCQRHTQDSELPLTVPKACKDYLQKKGLSTALFVPLHCHQLSPTHILNEVSSHLKDVVVAVQADGQEYKLRMSQGIPQGSILSSVLCDLYYGAMETLYMDPSLQGNGNLLLRHVDDYLLLTHCEWLARDFLSVLTSPVIGQEFFCVIKKEKTVTNINWMSTDTLHRCYEPYVQWCQYNIDLTNASISLPEYTLHDIQNSISFNGTRKPLAHIHSLLLKHISVFANPIYLDSVINDEANINLNLSRILRLSAIKFCYLQSFLLMDGGVAKNPKLWLNLFFSLSNKLFKIVKNHNRRTGYGSCPSGCCRLCLEQLSLACGSWVELASLRKLALSYLAAINSGDS